MGRVSEGVEGVEAGLRERHDVDVALLAIGRSIFLTRVAWQLTERSIGIETLFIPRNRD